MRIVKLAIVGSMAGILLVGFAMTQVASASDLLQPASAHQTAFEYDNYLYFAPEDDASDSPSDQPAPADESPSDAPAPAGTAPTYYYSQPSGIEFGAWIQAGISVNEHNPVDGYNGPVTFNDRDGEIQMNQLWLYVDKAIDNGGYGWGLGGHVDFVYGTDARFTQSAGLEDKLELDGERFYQAALPQFYLDIGYNDLTIRIGHFFSIIGYETVASPENFFYSHAYTMQYGEPFTHTGVLGIWEATDRVTVQAGFHRGWDQFENAAGSEDSMGFLGGVSWTSPSERVNLAFAISASRERIDALALDSTRMMYSFVGTFDLTSDLTYVFQHDCGQDTVVGGQAEWYGINQYLMYTVNPYWDVGLRFEWFRDDDGSRVTGMGVGNALHDPVARHMQGDFYEVTFGANWTPYENLVVRPEIRYDSSNARDVLAPAVRPFNAGASDKQFMVAIDMILSY